MRSFATRSRFTTLVLFAAALAVFTGTRAEAQINPLWDHYKVYFVNPPIQPPTPIPVFLQDQFGPYNHQALQLERYMNPVEKTVFDPPPAQTYPINDPLLHYSWWLITPQPFNGVVTAINQFGDHTFNVHDAIYLLNPSLKNQPGTGTLPQKNHYKCYFCDGPPVTKQVRMIDQFGPWNANVLFPRYFCNPVVKQVLGQPPNPIQDPNQHYVCYEFQPEDPNIYTASITDQFVENRPVELGPSRWLCVPTYKTGVTATRSNTWGKLKTLYR